MTTFRSHDHLLAHHGDFARFVDTMIETTPGRFGAIWWGVWNQHVVPPEQAEDRFTIVDLGTGPGLLLPMLRERHPRAELVGVEIQPEMLKVARRSAERAGARLVEADLADPLPLDAASADVVTLVMAFHELAHPPAILDEIARILRPGGRLVLYDWVRRPLEAYLEGGDPTPEALAHFREHCLFAPEDLEFLCRRVGLEIIERIDRRGGNFSIVVARRPGEDAG